MTLEHPVVTNIRKYGYPQKEEYQEESHDRVDYEAIFKEVEELHERKKQLLDYLSDISVIGINDFSDNASVHFYDIDKFVEFSQDNEIIIELVTYSDGDYHRAEFHRNNITYFTILKDKEEYEELEALLND